MTRTKACYEDLYRDYFIDKLTLKEIALKFGYWSDTAVARRISKLGIPPREGKAKSAPLTHRSRLQFAVSYDLHLTSQQLSICIGGLLGDAYAQPLICRDHRPRRNSYITWNHGQKQVEYIHWKAKILQPFTNPPRIVQYPDGVRWRLQTFSHPDFTELRYMFYPNGKKEVTTDILAKTDPLALSVWFMDDACYNQPNRCIQWATQGFSLKEQELIQTWLREVYRLETTLVKTGGGSGKSLRVGSKATRELIKLLEPFVIPTMRYKLGC